jgi:tripeptidyl-peptidase-1
MYKYGRFGADATFNVVRVNNGGDDPSNPHPEPNLDIQYAEGIAYPTPLTFYSTGAGLLGRDEPFAKWLEYILDEPSIPPTISISYGNEEKDYPYDHAKYVCFLFARLAARRVSVLFASGDYGFGKGDCGAKGGPGNVQFATLFPRAVRAAIFVLLQAARAQIQVAHHTGFSQVPMSPVSADG